MRKSLFPVFILVACCALFSGCSKNNKEVLTINPSMTASLNGTYNFTAATVQPSTIDEQVNDTLHALQITGNSSSQFTFTDKIVLQVIKYNGTTGVFSIVMGQAGAAYVHNNVPDVATGGIVAITSITSNSIIGYFSFVTASGISVTNGNFNVGKP